MKFLVDMPLSPELGRWLRMEGHHAVHASDMALNEAPDQAILVTAANEGRVIVTADLDFPGFSRHSARWDRA